MIGLIKSKLMFGMTLRALILRLSKKGEMQALETSGQTFLAAKNITHQLSIIWSTRQHIKPITLETGLPELYLHQRLI